VISAQIKPFEVFYSIYLAVICFSNKLSINYFIPNTLTSNKYNFCAELKTKIEPLKRFLRLSVLVDSKHYLIKLYIKMEVLYFYINNFNLFIFIYYIFSSILLNLLKILSKDIFKILINL